MKKLIKNKKILLFLVPITFLGIFLGFRITRPKTSLKINFKNAQTIKVTRGDLEKDLTLAGKVDAGSYALLQFQTSGRLAWVGVKEGNEVKKWQAIASLDKQDLEKQLKKTMNDYLTNRWNFEDTQDEYRSTKENFLVTDEIKRILERKQFSLENAVYDVEIADLTVRYATLVSPINGILTAASQSTAGVNITPLTATFTVVDPSSIYFKSEIDEEDVINIKEGQSTTITLDSFPDDKINSSVSYISFTPVEGQTSTVYKIKFVLPLDNKDNKYRIGMNGDAKIKLSEAKNVLFLPIEAINEKNNEKFVYLKDQKGKITQKIVKLGLETDDFVEVTEGIEEEDLVVYGS